MFDLGTTGKIKVDLISLFVFRPNKIERPDGRPFYVTYYQARGEHGHGFFLCLGFLEQLSYGDAIAIFAMAIGVL